MADEVNPVSTTNVSTPAAPSVVPDATPSAPSTVEVTPSSPESAPVITTSGAVPVVEEVKSVVTALGTEPPKTEKSTPEIKAPDAAPVIPVEGNQPVEQKKEEGGQSAEPAQLPTYEAFTFPENITLDASKLGEFTKDLGEFQNLTKADKAEVQKFGQKLVDRYVAEAQETVQRLNEHYTNTWEKMKSDWKEAFEKDPEIGGNRKDTTINTIADGLAQYGGAECLPPKDNPGAPSAFAKLMNETGVGNNPVLVRTFHNLVGEINRLKTKYESEAGVKPLPGTKPENAQSKTKLEKRYGRTT